jgi:hypothetical protein
MFGGGGGASAPAKKHALAGGAPGMWEMALIAICTSGADNRAYRSWGAIFCPILTA